MSSPTQRTLKLMRERGYQAEVVEKWIPGANIRKDLWGWCDVVGVKAGETLAVQATTASNISARVKKIMDSDTIDRVREAGWRIVVWGWKKVEGRWYVVERDIS